MTVIQRHRNRDDVVSKAEAGKNDFYLGVGLEKPDVCADFRKGVNYILALEAYGKRRGARRRRSKETP